MSCSLALKWHGEWYSRYGERPELPPAGERLGTARAAACGEDVPSSRVEIARAGDALRTADSRGRGASVTVDARTRIVGFARSGLPYPQEGDLVTVAGRRCRQDAAQRGLTAVTVRPMR
jgi:hypothetical protein